METVGSNTVKSKFNIPVGIRAIWKIEWGENERDVRNKWEYLERGIISTIVAKTTTIKKGIFFNKFVLMGRKTGLSILAIFLTNNVM
jgi:hypothetical protein